MRVHHLGAFLFLALTGTTALAQAPAVMDPTTGARPGHEPGVGISLPESNRSSNIGPADTRSIIAPTLPDAAVGNNAQSHEYLRAARTALMAGRTGQAQQSLEMAETRLLDRPVPQGMTNDASADPTVARLRGARMALGQNDMQGALTIIDSVLGR